MLRAVKMVYVLFAAVAAGAVIGGVKSLAGSPPPAVAAAEPEGRAPTAAEAPAPAAMGDEAPGEPGAAIEGEVLEVIDVQSYSYLRLGAKGSEGTWVAVPTSGLAVGARARVLGPMKMPGFTSAALKRTFPVIYFGTLEGSRAAQGTEAEGPAASPHGGGTDPQAVKPVERAKGPGAKTVAELIGQRTQLAGKTVRIHGTVVKSTPGILGKTYLHLRDGSGDAAAGTNDVTVTTAVTPKVGEVVLIEGVVVLDRDIGSGYKFATLVEDARVLPQ